MPTRAGVARTMLLFAGVLWLPAGAEWYSASLSAQTQAPPAAEKSTEKSTDKSEDKSVEKPTEKPAENSGKKGAEPVGFPPPPNAVRLARDYDIWIDPAKKVLIVDGKVVLREGLLEMFACPRQTKEHESVVSVNSKAQYVHAGLIALGANPGKPVQFDPAYQAATGPEIEVWVLWKDDQGNHKVRAQEWIQSSKDGKELKYPFVFGGSGFFVDESTGQKHYLAEAGDLICVSNFTSATLDLPVSSPQGNSDLVFKAFTERIPPLGTPVRLVLSPKAKPVSDSPAAAPAKDKPASSPPKQPE